MVYWIGFLALLAIASGIIGFSGLTPTAIPAGQALFAATMVLLVFSIVLNAVRRSRRIE